MAERQAKREREARRDADDHADFMSHSVTAERAALTAYLESPDWARECLIFAQEALREEMAALAVTRQTCRSCGGFGRGAYADFFTAAIAALTEQHDLPPVEGRPAPDWPLVPGQRFYKGGMLDGSWLTPAEDGSKARKLSTRNAARRPL